MDKILKIAKRLKVFTPEDIVMFCEIDLTSARRFLQESENIKPFGNKFEYMESVKTEEKFKIVDKNIECKNSDITVVEACSKFLKIWKNKNISTRTFDEYHSIIASHIIPFFKKYKLNEIKITDIEKFKLFIDSNNISARRIKNILTLLNQIIKYFQNEGYIERTCVFEVKKVANVPKRQIQILTTTQLAKLLKIAKRKYPYLIPIIQKLITEKRLLNSIMTGSEQQKKSLKRKIRKDFYKIKQEMGLENYKLDDLRYCNK